MKRIITVGLAIVMLASFAPQAHSIGAFLSWWDGKDTDSGFGLGVNKKLSPIPLLGVDIRLSWLKYGDADFNMFPLEVVGYGKLGLFYGGLGVGYYMFDSDIDSDLGWFLLAGAGLELAGIGVFGELKYTFLKTDVDLGTLGKQEIDASGFGINVGVTLPFF